MNAWISACILAGGALTTSTVVAAQSNDDGREAATATAAPSPAAAPAQPVVVHVAPPKGPQPPDSPVVFQDSLRSVLRQIGAEPTFRSIEAVSPSGVLAVTHGDQYPEVWLDLSDPRSTTLVVCDASHERFVVRKLDHPDGRGEFELESIRQIISSVLEAMLAGEEIGVTRAKAAESLKGPSPAVEPEPSATDSVDSPGPATTGVTSTVSHSPSWLLAVGGEWRALGPRVPFVGSLSLEAAARFPWGQSNSHQGEMALAASMGAPVSFETENVGATILPAAIDLPVGVVWLPEARWGWVGRASPRLELTHVTPTAPPGSPVRLGEPGWLVNPALRVELGVIFQMVDVELRFSVVGDWVPGSVDYLLKERSEDQVVESPWPVRPGVRLAVAWRPSR